MRLARLSGFALVTILMVGVVAASTALASHHEFRMLPTRGNNFTLKGGISKLSTVSPSAVIACQIESGRGTITSMDTVGKLVVTYHECKLTVPGGTCTVHSVGAPEGSIATNTLKGELGTVKAATEATSKVGMLFRPEELERIWTFAANPCMAESAVLGEVAGEVTPVGVLQETSKIVFGLNAGKQRIKEISLLRGPVDPGLEIEDTPATLEATPLLTYEGPVEVS